MKFANDLRDLVNDYQKNPGVFPADVAVLLVAAVSGFSVAHGIDSGLVIRLLHGALDASMEIRDANLKSDEQ